MKIGVQLVRIGVSLVQMGIELDWLTYLYWRSTDLLHING